MLNEIRKLVSREQVWVYPVLAVAMLGLAWYALFGNIQSPFHCDFVLGGWGCDANWYIDGATRGFVVTRTPAGAWNVCTTYGGSMFTAPPCFP